MIHETHRFTSAVWDCAEYLLGEAPEVARRFLLAVQSSVRQLHETPYMGRRWQSTNPRLSDVRVWRVAGFPNHLIFYRIVEDGIEAVHLIHGARDVDALLTAET